MGVAPGVRLWAVRILNSAGDGLVSWYVCGLDWIAAQRDPADPTLPLFEAVNMSVAKSGSDDHNCGLSNEDLIHQAICRLVASGVTVVAAAGNNSFNASRLIPASYDEVITVSALADTDGGPGRAGWQRVLLVGHLRPGRHVRRLLQLRQRRRPDRAREVHLVHAARGTGTATYRAPRWPPRT